MDSQALFRSGFGAGDSQSTGHVCEQTATVARDGCRASAISGIVCRCSTSMDCIEDTPPLRSAKCFGPKRKGNAFCGRSHSGPTDYPLLTQDSGFCPEFPASVAVFSQQACSCVGAATDCYKNYDRLKPGASQGFWRR